MITVIIFYFFVFAVFIGYFAYTGKIYKEQFVISPLTFLTNNDLTFLISQNIYCYENILQLFVENSLQGVVSILIPEDLKNLLIQKLRATQANIDEFTISKEGNTLLSTKFQNQTNSPNSEITLEIVESQINTEDMEKRPRNEDKENQMYILTGDVVYIKFGESYLGSDNEGNVKFSTGTPSTSDTDFWWIVKIDRTYSENSYDNKIPNNGAIIVEKYSPASSTSRRLSTNCDFLKQITEIAEVLTKWAVDCVGEDGLEAITTGDLNFESCNIDELVESINSIGRDRSVNIDFCETCEHWQIRQKKT